MRAVPVLRGLWWVTLLVAGLICFITFYAKGGGVNLASTATTEIVLTLLSGALATLALAFAPRIERAWGSWALALLLALSFLTALSVIWSVKPDDSWRDAGRMLAYSGVFGAALALARLAPGRWAALLGGIVLAAVVVCGYALLTKVFPSLAPTNAFARLEEPIGYWNAIGLAAAMGAIGCMWLGSRRAGHALLSALAYPAMGLLLAALVLAYSRGALAAFAIGLALWFCLVPLRLRGAAVLIVGAVGAGAVIVWDFSKHALSSEQVALGERATAGHQLGVLLLAMLALLTLVGIAIGFVTARHAPSPVLRRRAGAILLGLMVLAVLAFAGALAHSQRGFSGSVSHAFDSLTNPNAKPPPNTPGRLTAVASVRARYWKEALQVFDAHPALGAGAEGYATAHLRFRHETLTVTHAHGFVVQTLADLGLAGVAVSLTLLLAWMAAAGRATHPFNRRWSPWSSWRGMSGGGGAGPGWRRVGEEDLALYTPERIGLLSMLCLVVVFGAHSLIDWTWYVPGNACVALICAGWLAGRGPLAAVPGAGKLEAERSSHSREWHGPRPFVWIPGEPGFTRTLMIGVVIVAALLAAWSQWEPQRSEDARQQALALLATHRSAAAAEAKTALARDPLSAEARFTLAEVQGAGGQNALARETLRRAVSMQPSNPQTWLELARFDLTRQPRSALSELQAAIYLDPGSIAPEAISPPNSQPESVEIYNDYIQALRASEKANASQKRARTALASSPRRAPGKRP